MAGQVIRRDEADNNGSAGDPHELWYRYDGKQIGMVGNNGTLETDYTRSIANRTQVNGTGAFRFGSAAMAYQAEFGPGLQPITSYSQGSAGGSYTVRAGDSLSSIAAGLWGDAALWSKLAEAEAGTRNSMSPRFPSRARADKALARPEPAAPGMFLPVSCCADFSSPC